MDLQVQLKNLTRDSMNGELTITEFEERVQTYAENYHALQLQQTRVSGSKCGRLFCIARVMCRFYSRI
jgi:hypothetical protein